MKNLKKNKIIIMFYTLILCFSVFWMWRVEKLEEINDNYNNIVLLDVMY